MAAGDSLAFIVPQSNEPPVASFGRRDNRNTTSPHPVVDLALNEIFIGTFLLPRHYAGGGITERLHFAMTSAVADDIKLQTEIERIGDTVSSTTNLDTDNWNATANTGDITVPGTAGDVDIISAAHTDGAQMGSAIVGDICRIRVTRIAVAGSDAAGDLEIRGIEIQETP